MWLASEGRGVPLEAAVQGQGHVAGDEYLGGDERPGGLGELVDGDRAVRCVHVDIHDVGLPELGGEPARRLSCLVHVEGDRRGGQARARGVGADDRVGAGRQRLCNADFARSLEVDVGGDVDVPRPKVVAAFSQDQGGSVLDDQIVVGAGLIVTVWPAGTLDPNRELEIISNCEPRSAATSTLVGDGVAVGSRRFLVVDPSNLDRNESHPRMCVLIKRPCANFQLICRDFNVDHVS